MMIDEIDTLDAGTFVSCSFDMDADGGAEVSINVNTNDPYDTHCPPQSVYNDEIEALGKWLLKCARTRKRYLRRIKNKEV